MNKTAISFNDLYTFMLIGGSLALVYLFLLWHTVSTLARAKRKNLVLHSENVNGITTFTITEPTGLIYAASSTITLYVPNQKAMEVEISNTKSETN